MWTAINLVKKTITVNDYGDLVETVTRRSVYAEEMSVGMNETYQAMAVGYKPEVKFRLENWMDYEGEELVEFRPFYRTETRLLRVLRTYRDGERLELVCYEGIDQPIYVEPVDPTPVTTSDTTPMLPTPTLPEGGHDADPEVPD